MTKTVFFSGLFLFAAGVFFSCGSEAQTPSADNGNTTATGPNGAALYKDKCVLCHGEDGKAGVTGASDLSVSKLSHAETVNVVKNGRKGMRAFGGEMSEEEIEAVVKYAESLRK